ncbi:MAG: fumarylacetoacetate hydrolase family protein [Rhodospirillaceae bacterium]|nr:fumarylacetoacetate hydrolase family protein [Rhodospirillaceae bacterium]
MAHWIRFEHEGRMDFGTLDGEMITIHGGDMFAGAAATAETVALDAVKVLTPCVPGKMPALWNNYHMMADKVGNAKPTHPLYFFKPPSSFIGTGETIHRPKGYDGRVVYEGEIGIVVGKTCRCVDEAEAADAIFGYTCINDITAADIIGEDESFAQWTRSKGFDGFGVFGPVIADDVDPGTLSVRTIINGDERQNYPVSDMILAPAKVVSLLSWDLTLEAGDVICCGTNVGVGTMKEPVNTMEIIIDGIGTLANTFEN